MRRLFPVAVIVLAVAAPAPAVIKVLTPLSRVVKDTPAIFVAEVDKVEPHKPGVVFKFVEDLKGKAPAERLAVNLTGDNFAKKDDHTKVMLDRLAPGRKLIVFTEPKDGTYTTFGFIEGTWFQMQGTTDPDTKAIRWAFLHCEPYFRRTFKGTTAELRAVLIDAVAGKKDPPEPDEKEPHGYGPVAEKKEPEPTPLPAVAVTSVGLPFASIPFHLEPMFGAIGATALLGPLALLAAIFPATFGGVAEGMKRWTALITIVSVNSLLAAGYFFLKEYKQLPASDPWWASERMLMGVLLAFVALGVVWSGRRYRVAVLEESKEADPPTRGDFFGLAGFAAVVGVILVVVVWLFGREQLFDNPGREFTATFIGLVAAAAYSGYRLLTRGLDDDPQSQSPRMSAPGEGVALSAMLLFGAILLTTKFAAVGGSSVTTHAGEGAPSVTAPKLQDFELWYETREMDRAMSAVTVTDKFVYLGGTRIRGFSQLGLLACVDRATGKVVWTFDSEKVPKEWGKTPAQADLRTIYSTPTVSDGKLYFGEGLHENIDCRLFCLDAATGKPLWMTETKSHTEGSPVVVGGKLYFSAGDDGMYCADANTGTILWQYPTGQHSLHIDTSLTVANGRVYGGSGYQTLAAFAVDATTGKEVWRKELPMRSFGTPFVSRSEVFYGIGSGNLTDDLSTEPEPGRPKETAIGGMVLCLDAATGDERWRASLPKSVHTSLAADNRHVYAASRDGWLYALSRTTGKQAWRASSGLPIVSGPVVGADPTGRFPFALYMAGPSGQVTCHDTITGATYWSRGIPELVGRRTEVIAQPTLVRTKDGREVFVPVTLTNKNNAETKAAIVRFTDTDPPPP